MGEVRIMCGCEEAARKAGNDSGKEKKKRGLIRQKVRRIRLCVWLHWYCWLERKQH